MTASDKRGKAFGSAALAGGIGGLIAGPVGAVVSAGLAGWLSSASDFEPERLEGVFSRVREAHQKWAQFDAEIRAIEARHAADFESAAREKWRKYYRLRNLSSVDDLNGVEFELAISIIYEKRGYKVTLTQATGDFGVDVLAEKGEEKLAIQAKRYAGVVGIKAVQEAASGAFYYKATKAVVVTNSFFTPKAKELAAKLGVDLINRKRLALMWEQAHPDNTIPAFDLTKYKELEPKIRHEIGSADFAARTEKRRKYRR